MNHFTNYVFIADDDEDDHFLLQLAFDQHCPYCSLQFVDDGLQLLSALAQSSFMPSLILLDLNMPRLNGFETLQILRYNFRYRRTPIVMLTTSERIDDRQHAFALEATDFITKPVQFDEWNRTVAQLTTTWLST